MEAPVKQVTTPEYAYARSVNADVWTDDSLAAYLSDGITPAGAVIARAIIERPSASHFLPDANKLLEVMTEEAEGSDYSEFVEDFPEVSAEALAELSQLLEPLKAWADRHCRVSFFSVTQAEPYTVTEADIAAARQYSLEEIRCAETAGLLNA